MNSCGVKPLAIYVHWPYCARICPYCDFNVYKNRDADPEKAALVAAIIDDLSDWRRRSGERHIRSVHFGGGTPSLMQAGQIGDILAAIDRLWGLPETAEIALEANPTDAARAQWEDFAAAGINRLSLGIQSFDDNVLTQLGRDHDGAMGDRAAQTALGIFRSVSLDMIFGHTGQTLAEWDADISRAIALDPHHISAYQLTIEDGTAFAKAQARGDIKAVNDDASHDLYTLGNQRLADAAYSHYEVSNHAKRGHESAHNLAYWQGLDYVGVGPGAHGRLTEGRLTEGRLTESAVKYATIAARRPADYITAVKGNGTGAAQREALSPSAWGDEYIMMGLRISDGISLSHYADITGSALPDDVIAQMVQHGLLSQNGDRLWATQTGRSVLNTVSAKLLGA